MPALVLTPVIRPASVSMRSIGRAEAEGHAALCRVRGELVREHLAVAGLVARQPQAADELVADLGQRRLGGDAAGRIEHLERHAELLQHLDVAADAVELLCVAEELQRALAALVIGDAGRARSSRSRSRLYSAIGTMRALLTA